jgi:hypothetical protein
VVNCTRQHGTNLILLFHVVIISELTIISDPSPSDMAFRSSLVGLSLREIFIQVEYTFLESSVVM